MSKNRKIKKTQLLVFSFYILVLICFSCVERQNYLEDALRFAGENRTELEKVLAHYRQNPVDSLKYKAAVFLIENMPGHYSYSGDGIRKYYKEIDSLLNTNNSALDMMLESERISNKYSNLAANLVHDIHIITSDYLIRNIDDAFKLWKEKPWAEHLDFDQFCDFLLPYKCRELQEFDSWRDTMAIKFSSILENRPYNDLLHYSVYEATSVLAKSVLEKLNITEFSTPSFSGYPFLSASIQSRVSFSNCYITADLFNCIMRALGIPSAVDYIPMWGRQNGKHSFYVVFDEKGNQLPVLWGLAFQPWDPVTEKSTAPKIIRKKYKSNEHIKEYQSKSKYKKLQLSVFDFDVTDMYVKTEELSIPVSTKGLKDKYVYISVFNNLQWDMLDFGKLNGKKAYFTKIARDHIYLVWGYNGSNLVPISDPFIIRSNGNIEYLIPDNSKTTTISLERKNPKRKSIAIYESRMNGGKIQASNHSDFANAETFYVYDSISFPDILNIKNNKAYRYWRYLSPAGANGNIAEVEFYPLNSDKIARGTVIGTDDVEKDYLSIGREAAFDGDILTYVDFITADSTWVGLDFSFPVVINRVRCTPRSDDNNIRIGDNYELFYWINGQWNSLGVQTAKEKILYYNSVPSNSLLWLRNLTRGKEERIFTYENGKQRFWYRRKK